MAKAEALKDAGNRHFKNEEYSKAIKCYKEGLELDPGNPTINCNLAQAYLAVKDFTEAEVHAVVTLAHQTDSVKGFYRATKAALGMAKRERALSYLQTGLLNCPKAEELKSLYEEISKENEDADSSINNSSKLDSDKEENKETLLMTHLCKNTCDDSEKHEVNSVERERPSRSDQNKLRSRSSASCNRKYSPTSTDKVAVRSVSVNRSMNEKLLHKKGSEPKSDEFLDTLMKVQNELSPEEKSPQQKEREALMDKKKKLQTCMKEGSEALEIGLAKQASEKYKCALDIMTECNIEVFGLSEVDRIILKYSLSICWIETLNYNNIIQSVGYLMEIETNFAAELPAIYYGLGQAFYHLNRFKVALDHLDKGIKVTENCTDVIPHPWPGTMRTILETTKVGLEESLSKLCYECKTYREPDAICRYEKCLTVTTHICPSEIIFFSDPDFVGYVVIICKENCKITYHVGCWKHYKENLSSVGKLTDKDVLGRACLTSDCINERNEISVIVRIEVYGEDGKIKTSCSKEPTRTDSVNEHRKERKKKNEKTDKPVKVRVPRVRVRRLIPNAQNVVKKIKRKSTMSSEEFAVCIYRLAELRETNFGIEETASWNPQNDYFGRSDISALKTYLSSYSSDSETLRERKDFIYTYFYEYLKDEGPQKVSTIEKKWKEDVSHFPGISEFISQHDGVCDFLLQSYRFACIDDYLCLADQLTETYQRVQEEVDQSITFILIHSSQLIENEPDVDNIDANKRTHKLSEAASSSNGIPDLQFSEHPDAVSASSSQGCSSEIFLNRKDSECDYLIGSSESDLEEESVDDKISMDSENEFYENTIINNYSNYEDMGACATYVQESMPVVATVPEQQNSDIFTIPIPHSSSSTTSVFQKLPDVDIKVQEVDVRDCQPNISDNATQNIDVASSEPCLKILVLKNVDTQTESYYDLEKEIETLNTTNAQLTQNVEIWNDEKQKLICSFQEERNEYKQKIQMYESRISNLVVEKEKNENDMQFQIGIRDNKFEVMKKKYQEQIDQLIKRKEEDAYLMKKNLECVTELNKEVEKKANTIDRLEGQLRRANEQILNIRKLFGEYKLDSYLAKCNERLLSLNIMAQYLQNADEQNTSSIDEIKISIEAWEHVARELRETQDLLQVQYDILSQQLKNKVSSDCLLQLELAELPPEPPYPLRDMNNVVHLTTKYIQCRSPSSNGKNISEMETPRPNMQYLDNTPSSYPAPLLGIQAFPPQDVFSMRATNSFGYRPPFLSNSFNGFSRTMPTAQTGHFSSQSSDEKVPSAIKGSWPSEFQVNILKNDTPDHIAVGNKPGSRLMNNTGNLIDSAALKHVRENIDPMSSGWESDICGTGNNISGGKEGANVLLDSKQRDTVNKKASFSTVSGLTPIETRSGIVDTKGATSKIMSLEVKRTMRTQKLWNYQQLFSELQNNFRLISEVELSECLIIVREKNGTKLSGLSISTIIQRVGKVLEERSNKKIGNMGMDKFGGAAWGEVKESDVNWHNDDIENECVICHVIMESSGKTRLQCKHTFHTECIRQWLHTNSTCPICRKYTRLIDEFPPLA